jgi:hypothetical protein
VDRMASRNRIRDQIAAECNQGGRVGPEYDHDLWHGAG